MGLELFVLGIRKLCDEEVGHLSGKTVEEMKKSGFYHTLFEEPGLGTRYNCSSEAQAARRGMDSIRHMLSPVPDAEGRTVYVFWEEKLAHYWEKSSWQGEEIERLLETVQEEAEFSWEDWYHVVPFSVIRPFCGGRRPSHPEDMEIVAFLYG